MHKACEHHDPDDPDAGECEARDATVRCGQGNEDSPEFGRMAPLALVRG